MYNHINVGILEHNLTNSDFAYYINNLLCVIYFLFAFIVFALGDIPYL